MRLFIAVNFCENTKNEILQIQEKLRSRSQKGNFSRPENFHLTLAFLGETPEEKIPAILDIINRIKTPPFKIYFDHTGCFSRSRKELWYIGVKPDCPGLTLLKTIHGQLLDSLLKAGCSVDERPFRAHITLGRQIKCPAPVILDKPDILVNVDRISLMRSENIKGKLIYTEIANSNLSQVVELNSECVTPDTMMCNSVHTVINNASSAAIFNAQRAFEGAAGKSHSSYCGTPCNYDSC